MSAQDFRTGTRLAPGVYDYQGELHVDEEEFIRGTGGDPGNERHLQAARRAIAKVCAERGIEYVESD